MDKKFVGKKAEPSVEELVFIYSRLQRLSDAEILDEMQDEPFLLRSPGFIKRRRKEFAAAKTVLESVIALRHDPLRIEHQREHLKEIALLLERWGDNLETARNIAAYGVTYDVEEKPLFPYVLQHCPSVSEKYKLLELKRREFNAEQGALAEQIAQEAPPEATKWFSKVAAYYSVELALERSLPSYSRAVHADVWALYAGEDKVIAKGSPEAMERCEELHKRLIRKYADSPEVSSIAKEAKNLQAIQKELAQAIENNRLRQEWINNECDCCPDNSMSYQQ